MVVFWHEPIETTVSRIYAPDDMEGDEEHPT